MGLAPGFRGIRRKTAKFASLRPIPAFSYVSSEALWSPLDTCNLALSGNSWQQCRLPSELRQFPRPVDSIFHHCYILSMEWDIEFTDEFERWWNGLSEDEQNSVDQMVRLLQMRGPSLGRPHADLIQSSRHSNMKELRVQHAGRPYRVLFAFDPKRCAILLTGGDKTGNDRWYEEFVPIADRLYEEHLVALEKEKRNNG